MNSNPPIYQEENIEDMRVSEVVTIEEINNWNNGDTITIKAGTGAGKSYFIKNILYALAKRDGSRILLLVHRTNCKNQFIEEIKRDGKTDVIHIETYQKLEHNELIKKDCDFSTYKYIVCDEFHYFMSDAAFNKTTDISLNLILKQDSGIKIFMSATGDNMKSYINMIKGTDTIDYELPINYDFIESLAFYNKDETLDFLIEKVVEQKYKAIFFVDSAKKAYDLYRRYPKHCLFNCSRSNSEFYHKVDQTKINNMLRNERFDEQILITTTCMDAGVNIIDTNLKHIVCDVKDIGTLVQCIGRKRIQNKDDKLHLYIKNINNKSLGGKETKLNKKVKMADYLQTHTVKEFIEEYHREYDASNIVYDDTVNDDDKGTKKVNELMFFKVKNDLANIAEMKNYGEHGYCKYMQHMFGVKAYKVIEEDHQIDKIVKYVDQVVGKKLTKEERQELIDIIDLRDSRKRQQKSIKSLNTYFETNNMRYLIVNKSSSEMINGKKKGYRYWEIIKIA
ncbi:DEAD/DEAH box helicase family protein [Desulfosporosinus hippei]|uniref:Helicase conserved C-terminal domain-containing protein n=1 Tax=Desulfosporosinus hippei DSM 8344 TaxID=1121419 RepID=A0A1G7Z5P9_9FIRM|nr:DEAD/DEAH box helicase family protein [Desulfosporosinus hippei]SDH03915.1 Helicase conserved C-terminal domain-containing protein [Desulfosporosinus hippei DSM 8344]